MSKYIVQLTHTGKYAVTDGTETLAVMHCPHAAQTACDALNYEPGKNPFDVYLKVTTKSGRPVWPNADISDRRRHETPI